MSKLEDLEARIEALEKEVLCLRVSSTRKLEGSAGALASLLAYIHNSQTHFQCPVSLVDLSRRFSKSFGQKDLYTVLQEQELAGKLVIVQQINGKRFVYDGEYYASLAPEAQKALTVPEHQRQYIQPSMAAQIAANLPRKDMTDYERFEQLRDELFTEKRRGGMNESEALEEAIGSAKLRIYGSA
jgi:hypothetical protein